MKKLLTQFFVAVGVLAIVLISVVWYGKSDMNQNSLINDFSYTELLMEIKTRKNPELKAAIRSALPGGITIGEYWHLKTLFKPKLTGEQALIESLK